MYRRGHLCADTDLLFPLASNGRGGGRMGVDRTRSKRPGCGSRTGAIWVVSEVLDVPRPHLPVGFGVWMP